MRRAVLILTLLIALTVGSAVPALALAKWRPSVVTVRVYASEAWRPYVTQAVADYNAVMPAGGPLLVIQEQRQRGCKRVENKTFRRPTITICSRARGGALGRSWWDVRGGVIAKRAHITLQGDPVTLAQEPAWHPQTTACHEMLHALTAVRDRNYTQTDSCFLGWLHAPGPWDIALLEQVYGTP